MVSAVNVSALEVRFLHSEIGNDVANYGKYVAKAHPVRIAQEQRDIIEGTPQAVSGQSNPDRKLPPKKDAELTC